MDDYLSILRHEHEARDGSFMYRLTMEMAWDKAAFARMTDAMQACCAAYTLPIGGSDGGPVTDETPLPRWLADFFWTSSFYIRDWTTPPNWPEPSADERAYYAAAYDTLSELAAWFFRGVAPRRGRGRL